MNFLINFFTNFLLFLNGFLPNLGIAIIAFTIIIRSLLLLITLPSLKSMEKIKSLKGEIDKLKKKYKKDPKALQLAQVALYKKHNVNPLAGCLPQILQIIVLISLYRALMEIINNGAVHQINSSFLWLDLTNKPITDLSQSLNLTLFILPVLAFLSQFLFSIMLSPGAETPNIIPDKSKNKNIKELNKKEENTAMMASTMQKQMMFMMPVMTFVLALNFPAGLTLYWIMSTTYSIFQQYFISGWGGLKIYLERLKK
jgi:YidC/Oxa1 family membrane protein insertase